MRILYVAKHDSGGNDDEGAISYALTQLGHHVIKVDEGPPRNRFAWPDADMVLFHKWEHANYALLQPHLNRPSCAKVCWYFDLVNWDDPALYKRCAQRIGWMRNTLPAVDYMFCTDGDWAGTSPRSAEWRGKLYWLPQGADERVVGTGPTRVTGLPPILMTGIGVGGGTGREAFVGAVKERYGDRFQHIQTGLYRDHLKNMIASTAIVLCPDSPVTDRYWSNRVYNSAGFGAFILHPWAEGVGRSFRANKEIVFYHDRHDLWCAIDFYLDRPAFRQRVADAALARVRAEHLYRHRCDQLISTVTGGPLTCPTTSETRSTGSTG